MTQRSLTTTGKIWLGGGIALLCLLASHSNARTTKPTTRANAPATKPTTKPVKKPSYTLPSTDIWLASVSWRKGIPVFTRFRAATKGKSYDNQPAFLPSGDALLYTSNRAQAQQTDVFRYDLKTRRHTRLTATPESEFSPTPMASGKRFSTVRVERDLTQRLWHFPLHPKGPAPGLLFPNLKPVGYHVWASPEQLAFFILGKPHTLQIADTKTKKALPIVGHIGRALIKIPGQRQAILFVHKLTKQRWWLKTLDLQRRQVAILGETPKGSEDIAITGNGVILMSKGSKLYRWRMGTPFRWTLTADLSNKGLRGITRIVFSPDASILALVAKHDQKRKRQNTKR